MCHRKIYEKCGHKSVLSQYMLFSLKICVCGEKKGQLSIMAWADKILNENGSWERKDAKCLPRAHFAFWSCCCHTWVIFESRPAPNLQIPYKSLCTQTCLPIFLAEHFLGYKNFGPLRTPFPYQIQSVSNIRILEYMCHKYLFRHLFVSTSSFAPFRCSGRVTHALVIR